MPDAFFIGSVLCGLLVVGSSILTSRCFWRARMRASIQRVRDTERALARYSRDRRRCPATRDDLAAGRYIQRRELDDAWATSVAYWCSGLGIHALSAGPDRLFNTRDDITSATFAEEGPER